MMYSKTKEPKITYREVMKWLLKRGQIGGNMKAYKILWGVIALPILFLLMEPLTLSARAAEGNYSREQLSQMLAPVALYPDALLAQVLMASTYPLEVVEADRWIKKNPMLTDSNLDDALKDKDWDASVKALCHVPELLALMSERLEETTDLGNAFLAQESEVMGVIQDLRHSAYEEGNLSSNDKQTVIFKSDGTIVIESARPQTVYVPYYNTRYVYGTWLYPAYPPWYWGPPGVMVGTGFYYWPDFYVGFGLGFGYWSYFDWPRRTIIINVHRQPAFIRHDVNWASHRGIWHHDVHHRRGVVYRDRITAEKFGQYPRSGQVFDRGRWRYPSQNRENHLSRQRRGSSSVRSSTTMIPATVPKPGVRKQIPAGKVRVTMPPERRAEEAWRRERPERQESATVFGGIGNGREETRSSIRGGASRGAMRQHGKEEGHGTPSNFQQRGGRGGGGRGLHR
jgi:hypothetical protein